MELEAQFHILNGDYSEGSAIFDEITEDYLGFSDIDIYKYRDYNDAETANAPQPLNVWLNQTNVIKYLGLDPSVTFQDCNAPMYLSFYNDISQSYADNITYLLTNPINPIPVLLYNGQDDIIVNTPGALAWINEMNWYGNTGFKQATRLEWLAPNGTSYGNVKKYQNFTFVTVYGAGHMVPGDQPASARDMLNRFIYNHWN